MKRRTWLIGGLIVALGVGALLVLRSYQLELIHATIENAVAQKAPEDYPRERILQRFDEALRSMRNEGREEIYQQRLLALAQRLEKIQRLDADEIEEILVSLTRSKPDDDKE